jgi:hypothetical protein
MKELNSWFEKQARRERRAVYLEEALLGKRFWAYSIYRLRYFFARYVVASLTHAVTVVLLYRFFDRREFVVVLLAYSVASMISSFWWGSLEAMRGEVRRLYRVRAPHLIPKAIGRWLSLSLQLTCLFAICTVLGLGFQLLREGALGPAGLYVVAIGLRLAVQFFTRGYHSGIYAIRRVYRPLPAIIGVEFVGITIAIVLSPLLGVWALPVGALLATPIVAGLSIYYTRRTYQFMGLSPMPFVTVWRLRPLPKNAIRDFVGGGFSYALMSADSLLVLVLFATERDSIGETGLFALFFLLAPTVRACSEWAQLLYFDLKRLEIRLFTNLRSRFERDVRRLAVALGLVFSSVAALVGAVAYRAGVTDLALSLVPFFVSMSLLATAQIKAYADRAYPRLIRNTALCLGGYVAVGLMVTDERTIVLLFAAVAFGGFLLLESQRGRLEVEDGHRVLWPTEWLAELRSVKAPVRVAAARYHTDVGVDEDDTWRRRQVADQVARYLGQSGKVTLIEPGLLVWYQRPEAESAIGERSLSVASGGLLRWVGAVPGADGRAALRSSAAVGLLGRSLATMTNRGAPPLDVDELRAVFGRMFTSGIVYAPDEPIPARLDALPSEDKRAAVADAAAFARELRLDRPRSKFHTTALCEAGELRLIFLVSRRAPRRLRDRWETLISRRNLQGAMALAEPDG